MNPGPRLSLTSFPCSSLASTAHQDAATVQILFRLPPLDPLVPPCHQNLPVCRGRGAATYSALPVCRAAPLPRHTRLFPYVARLLSLDILGSSRMSRGSSPSTYSALPVCYGRAPPHTRLFPYVARLLSLDILGSSRMLWEGSRHILGSSRMSRASSCMSRLPSRNIFGPRHPPLHPFPLLHSPCTVALHYNR